MSRIPDLLINCTFYLYPSKRDAIAGKKAGGSGFIVLFTRATVNDQEVVHLYGVTNSHVVRPALGNSPVIRYNTKNDEIGVIELDARNWYHHPDGDDIAVCPIDQEIILSNLDNPSFKRGLTLVPKESFLTIDELDKLNIGPGDDVFTIGRFVNHEGIQRNLPTVRFGSIAQMPNEAIRLDSGLKQEAFLVESRSISGYSGAPVFIHIPAYTNRWDGKGLSPQFYTRLLGINCAHLPFHEKVIDKHGNSIEDYRINGNSGIAVVIPAWKLLDVLTTKELVEMREKKEKALVKQNESSTE